MNRCTIVIPFLFLVALVGVSVAATTGAPPPPLPTAPAGTTTTGTSTKPDGCHPVWTELNRPVKMICLATECCITGIGIGPDGWPVFGQSCIVSGLHECVTVEGTVHP